MKLALTLEADSVNVQALNMVRIVFDIDGVNLAELINMVCDNGYSLRVVDESDRTSADCTPPFVAPVSYTHLDVYKRQDAGRQNGALP